MLAPPDIRSASGFIRGRFLLASPTKMSPLLHIVTAASAPPAACPGRVNGTMRRMLDAIGDVSFGIEA